MSLSLSDFSFASRTGTDYEYTGKYTVAVQGSGLPKVDPDDHSIFTAIITDMQKVFRIWGLQYKVCIPVVNLYKKCKINQEQFDM